MARSISRFVRYIVQKSQVVCIFEFDARETRREAASVGKPAEPKVIVSV